MTHMLDLEHKEVLLGSFSIDLGLTLPWTRRLLTIMSLKDPSQRLNLVLDSVPLLRLVISMETATPILLLVRQHGHEIRMVSFPKLDEYTFTNKVPIMRGHSALNWLKSFSQN